MRFSILTITYNAEKFLKETIESVLAQDFKDYEHIIFDGGSSDATLAIAQSYPHLKIVRGKDSGISCAMNQVAKLAQGEFLLHLHADDLLASPKSLSIVDTAFRHYNVKWLYGQSYTINPAGKIVEAPKFISFDRNRLLKYNIISHPSTFIARSLFLESSGFDTSLKYCMDYDLWLRLSLLETPLALPYYLSSFREHPNSTSTKEKLKVADESYLVRNRYQKNLLGKLKSYRTWKKRRAPYV